MLGVGASVTLAAWTDSENTQATFTAGTFSIVGATDGTQFTEHPSQDNAATLEFVTAPTAMAPGTVVYALYSVRTADQSVAGTVHLQANEDNSSELGQYLTYGVRTIGASTTCNASTFATGTNVVAPGSSLTTSAAVGTTQAVQANSGNQINYCFEVTLPTTAPNDAQGKTVAARWQFDGTSS